MPDFGPKPVPRPPRPRMLVPQNPAASRPNPWAADLKPFKPYRYKGIGFDIFNPDEDEEDWS